MFANVLRAMGNIPADKLQTIISKCHRKILDENVTLIEQDDLVKDLYFIESGATRHFTHDKAGNEHTTHFAFENEFSTDYGAFISGKKSDYSVQTLKPSGLIVIPNEAYEWMRENVAGGEKLIRIVTEGFYIYFATRLRDFYVLSPLERYQAMEQKFPGIYEEVPQYMIASYIGVTKVHLSRLKSQSLKQKNAKT